MKRVIKILMERDGLSVEDAKAEIQVFLDDAEEAIQNGDYDEAEELLMSDLGLEPDYLMDILM